MIVTQKTDDTSASVDRRNSGLTFKNSLRSWQARWKAQKEVAQTAGSCQAEPHCDRASPDPAE